MCADGSSRATAAQAEYKKHPPAFLSQLSTQDEYGPPPPPFPVTTPPSARRASQPPPVFLQQRPGMAPPLPPHEGLAPVQIARNADLCACKNYHETLLAQGVRSELVLVKPSYGDSSCPWAGRSSVPPVAAAQMRILASCVRRAGGRMPVAVRRERPAARRKVLLHRRPR